MFTYLIQPAHRLYYSFFGKKLYAIRYQIHGATHHLCGFFGTYAKDENHAREKLNIHLQQQHLIQSPESVSLQFLNADGLSETQFLHQNVNVFQ